MAIRVCCAYRAAYFHAAMIVAGVIPLDHLAPRLAEAYAALRGAEGPVLPGITAAFGFFARWGAVVAWREEKLGLVCVPGETGVRVRAAIADKLVEWAERLFSIGTTFHTTQLMTGHGCFPAYLYRICRAASPRCFYCGVDEDDADHTLIVCLAVACAGAFATASACAVTAAVELAVTIACAVSVACIVAVACKVAVAVVFAVCVQIAVKVKVSVAVTCAATFAITCALATAVTYGFAFKM
ncbi:PREDICTED: uncharacterized protein LOC106792768 [Polistes canadensis]|uniref:uncharacterized protein LOC106792768 n=1 Tax=Polistes canadensis TaxID=91411 RepID=UPI000718CFB0|nr:PREDICTED: uncharacterized protein LOC106792768 [Polistes canadensis]